MKKAIQISVPTAKAMLHLLEYELCKAEYYNNDVEEWLKMNEWAEFLLGEILQIQNSNL